MYDICIYIYTQKYINPILTVVYYNRSDTLPRRGSAIVIISCVMCPGSPCACPQDKFSIGSEYEGQKLCSHWMKLLTQQRVSELQAPSPTFSLFLNGCFNARQMNSNVLWSVIYWNSYWHFCDFDKLPGDFFQLADGLSLRVYTRRDLWDFLFVYLFWSNRDFKGRFMNSLM